MVPQRDQPGVGRVGEPLSWAVKWVPSTKTKKLADVVLDDSIAYINTLHKGWLDGWGKDLRTEWQASHLIDRGHTPGHGVDQLLLDWVKSGGMTVPFCPFSCTFRHGLTVLN